MKLLVIGGTVFVGRHLVEAALAAGHEVTLFNRGKSNPDLFPEVVKLHGDRSVDLSSLDGRSWDAAVDICGYVPRAVHASAERLSSSVGHYTFVSTVSVYADYSIVGMDESAPVGTLPDESTEEVTEETYGPLKALCERAVEAALPGRALIARPGLIVGPEDLTDRFTYWPHRIACGGEVLAPGRPDRLIQLIDVRDLGEWMLRMIEAGRTGVFNATGPEERMSMQDLLETCIEETASDAWITWVDEQFLLNAGVKPWTELPVWIPEQEMPGLLRMNCSKAIATGLSFRSIVETVRDTLVWLRARPETTAWRAGISNEREHELLRSWHAHARIA